MSTEQVVFLHGLEAGPDSWDAQLATLPEGFSGSAPHIPGLSDEGEAEFSFVGAAAEIVRGLDRRGVERAHMCGLSIGAMLALRIVVDHPDRVASLVLSGGQINPSQVVMGLQSALTRILPAWVIAPNGMSKRRTLAALDEVSRVDFRAHLPEVDVPALVLCGSWDLVNLPAARATVAGLPNARLRIVEGGGHELNVHRPADFAAELDTFYRGDALSQWPRLSAGPGELHTRRPPGVDDTGLAARGVEGRARAGTCSRGPGRSVASCGAWGPAPPRTPSRAARFSADPAARRALPRGKQRPTMPVPQARSRSRPAAVSVARARRARTTPARPSISRRRSAGAGSSFSR